MTTLYTSKDQIKELIESKLTSASNLKGLWFFDVRSGTSITDYSGNGNDITLSKDASQLSPDGKGLTFNASNIGINVLS